MKSSVTTYSHVVGLVPAGGMAARIAPLPCSKEIYPIGFTAKGEGRPRSRVAAHCLLEGLRHAGATQTYIILRQGKWDIPAYLGDGSQIGLPLAYLMMNAPWGVPYTVDQAFPFVREALIMFGFADVLFEPDDAFLRLRERLTATDADLVLGLFPAQPPYECDRVATDEAGRVQRILIKPDKTDLHFTWTMAAWTAVFTQFLHDQVIAIDPDKFRNGTYGELFMGRVMQDAIDAGLRVNSVSFSDGRYTDIGTADGLKAVTYFATHGPDRK